jgi:peptidoglycan lytic transglycosylase
MRALVIRLFAWLAILGVEGSALAESGIASIYSGRGASKNELTAAHRTLPFGARVRVTNRKNGASATVRISDRGPFVRGRVIDVSPAAARSLRFKGTTRVEIILVGED